MNSILLYSRNKLKSPVAEQTLTILAEQLQQTGHHVDVCHSLNIPRLILNSYQTVHVIIESLPLTASEALHIGICKALGKNTLISILNSDHNLGKGLLNFVMPDALSVSQTNHFKHYRRINSNKFIMPAFPKHETAGKRTSFKFDGFMIPLSEKIEEAFQFEIKETVYFDGRKLLDRHNSVHLRKKWNDLIAQKKIADHYFLILSDNKINELLHDESLAVVLAAPYLNHTEFTQWLNLSLNKKNLIVLNDYQATGFSNYWTSGQNCMVVPVPTWRESLAHFDFEDSISASTYKSGELFQPTVNELSRLYSKLLQQKTTLLTSRSAKL